MLGWRFRNHYFLLCVCEPVATGYVRLEVQKSLLPVVCVCEPVAMGYVRLEVQKSLLPVVCVCEPVAMGKPCDAGLIVFSK